VYRLGTCLLLAPAAFAHLGATDRAAVLGGLRDAHLPDHWKG
jgi:hypothetical protein